MSGAVVGVAVAVLNWRRPGLALACLEALLALPEYRAGRVRLRILLVDNHSGDDSMARFAAFIRERPQAPVELIQSPRNLGYAAGNNLAIRRVLAQGAERWPYFWVLNSDTRPLAGSLLHLVRAAEAAPEVLLWGSTLLEPWGAVQCAGGCDYYPSLSVARPRQRGLALARLEQRPRQGPPDYICGAALFMRLDRLGERALLDEGFFLFFEELALARAVGGKARQGWAPRSWVRHGEGASMPRRGAEKVSAVAEYHADYSALQYTRRFHPLLLLPAGLFRLAVKTALYLAKARWEPLRALYRAYGDFLFKGKRRLPE